jgi:hypothetical protein
MDIPHILLVVVADQTIRDHGVAEVVHHTENFPVDTFWPLDIF